LVRFLTLAPVHIKLLAFRDLAVELLPRKTLPNSDTLKMD
jgi:hypothetical protein